MNTKLALPVICIAAGLLIAQPAAAQHYINCSHALLQDPVALSKDSGEGDAWPPEAIAQLKREQAECRQRAVVARERLRAEFDIDATKMTDALAITRLDEELDRRRRAEEAAAFERRAAESRRQEDTADAWADKGSSMMQQQDAMLRNMGIDAQSIPGMEEDDEDYDEDEDEPTNSSGVDPVELQMYEDMVRNGVAPKCKGMKDMALIDCVDAAIDAEEE